MLASGGWQASQGPHFSHLDRGLSRYRKNRMAELVNLRTVRKRAKRQQDERQAAANRLIHGQPKHVRDLDQAREAKAAHDLDQHRIDTGDAP